MNARIRVQALDGQWETLGVDRYAGIHPDNINPTYNSGGPDGLTFTLRRDPALEYPDLEGDTPIELVTGGDRVIWSGYTVDAPGAEDAVTINARGWQHHAAGDDLISRLYAAEDLSAWRDSRDVGATLAAASGTSGFGPGLHVQATGERILIGAPQGTIFKAAHAVGVTFDAGPDAPWPVAAYIDVKRVGGAPANVNVYVRNHSTPSNAHPGITDLYQDGITPAGLATISTTGQTLAATFTVPRRYLTVFVYRTTAGDYTATTEDLLEITGARIFTDAAYHTAGASLLTADKIIKDVRNRALPLLSASDELIVAPATTLRALDVRDETPRAVWDRVNGYHAWRLKVRADRRVQFGPLPDRPALVVNTATPGVDLRDVSRQSAADIVNKVIVKGRSGSGRELRVTRYTAPAGNPAPAAGADAFTPINPGGASYSEAAGLASLGVVAPATLPAGSGIQINFTGTFLAGRRYLITFEFTFYASTTGNSDLRARIDTTNAVDQATSNVIVPTNVRQAVTLTWTPKVNHANATAVLDVVSGGVPEAQTLEVYRPTIAGGDDTLPGRRGKFRTRVLDVQAPTDETAMQALGDAYLRVHERTSFKGDLTISSDTAVRLIGSDAPVAAAALGAYTTELILIENLIDPDNGGVGRNGIIANVAGGIDGQPATVTLDNDRHTFEALLARMGVVAR